MPNLRINEKSLERIPLAKSTPVEYYDTAMTGFGVKAGLKNRTYFVKGAVKGKQFKRQLGRVDLMTLEEARQAAVAVLRDAAQGITPDDREKQQTAKEEVTLANVLKTYLATRKTLKESTRDNYKNMLDRYLPEWLDRPLNEITPGMVVSKHAEIGAKSKAGADGTFRVVRALFNYAMEVYEEEVTRNPVKRLSSLKAWYKVPRKQGFVKPTQLPLFLSILRQHPCMVSDYLEVLLFTGIRSASEIARLQIADVDTKEQTILLRETKNGKPLYVPVCKTVMAAMERRIVDAKAAGSSYLFYSTAGKADVGHIVDVRIKIQNMLAGTELAHITPHDLRRSFLTYANELQIPSVTLKRLVGHAIPTDVTDGYIVLTIDRLRDAVKRIESFILDQVELADL